MRIARIAGIVESTAAREKLFFLIGHIQPTYDSNPITLCAGSSHYDD